MTVALSPDGLITLSGRCDLDEAEDLLALLLAHPEASVDWRGCDAAHTAIVQLLLAAGRRVLGPANAPALTQYVEPLLAKA